jgi:hypothetical protein
MSHALIFSFIKKKKRKEKTTFLKHFINNIKK